MSVLAQGLTGLVLALALADLLVRQPAGLLALAVSRGLLAALALLAEGLILGASLTALAAGLLLPFLVWRAPGAPLPAAPWPTWVIAIVVTPLGLAVGPLGLPLAILLVGLLALLARPAGSALALTTMQVGTALVLPALAGMDAMGTGLAEAGLSAMGVAGTALPARGMAEHGVATTLAACLPVAAGLVVLAGRQPGWRTS